MFWRNERLLVPSSDGSTNCAASCIDDENEEFWLPDGVPKARLLIVVGYFESGILFLEKAQGSSCKPYFSSIKSVHPEHAIVGWQKIVALLVSFSDYVLARISLKKNS